MANAMLNEEFQSSHPDLMSLNNSISKSVSMAAAIATTTSSLDLLLTGSDEHSSAFDPLLNATMIRSSNNNDASTSDENETGHSNSSNGMLIVSLEDEQHPPPTPSNTNKRTSFYSNSNARKSVEFAILPPPIKKRSKTTTPSSSESSSIGGVPTSINSSGVPNPHMTTTQKTIHAIATSFTPSERLAAVQLAKETLDHTDAAMHNEELRLGADSVLAKHLAFVLHENQQHHQAVAAQNVEEEEPEAPRRPPATMLLHSKPLPSETTKSAANSCSSKDDATIPDSTIANTRSMIRTELSLTCDALESVFRASSTVVGASFRRLGSLLLQLLVSLLNDEIIQRRRCGGNCNDVVPMESLSSTEKTHPPLALPDPQSAPDIEVTKTSLEGANPVAGSTSDKLVVEGNHFDASSSDEGDAILKHATKMLGHFARVGETTQPMAHYPGLLSSLIALVELRSYQGAPWEARLPALWTLANLACNEENMRLMACYPGLIQALVNVANRQLHSSDSLETTMEVLRSRALASRAIFNLSWSPENKVLLAEQVNVVDFLADLIILRSAPKSLQKSSTVHEILSSTRCHAAGALRNLAAAPRRIKLHMCHHRKGHLLNVLTDAAINDIDKRVKFRAFATIHNLAIHDTAQTLASHPALVMALKDVLLSTEDASELVQDSTDGTLKEHASATLLVLERSIKPSMDSYVNILDLLDAIHPTDDSVGGTAHLDSSCDFANQIAAG